MKRISLFAMALVAGIAVNAQNDPQLRTPREVTTRFGIKAGINSARLEVDDNTTTSQGVNTNAKTSYHAGLFVNMPLSENIRLQPELLYSNQGSKTSALSSADPNLAGIGEFDLHYISLPVMLQYMSTGGFFVELGPQVSYLSSANGDRQGGEQENLKEGNYIKSVDFAAGGGVGYLTRIGLGINARYMYGFTNVWNNKDRPATTTGMNWGNRNLQVSLSYHFGANK